MMTIPPAPESWRVNLLALQHDFRETALRHWPLLAEVIIGPLPVIKSQAEFAQICQSRVSQGRFLAMYAFERTQTESFQCSLVVEKKTEPSEQDELAASQLAGLRSRAVAYLSQAPDELLAKVVPSRNRPSAPNKVPTPQGQITDDWLEVLFHLAWNHPSPILYALPQVWLQRQANMVDGGRLDNSQPSVFAALSHEDRIQIPGFVKPFPHSLFSRLKFDVWRSSEAAIDVIMQLAPVAGNFDGRMGAAEARIDDGPKVAPTRIQFDSATLTVTLDGQSYKIDNPKAFTVYKHIVDASPNPMTRATIQSKVAGCSGKKRIRQLLNELPPPLSDTVQSGNWGYVLSLSSQPNAGG